MVVVSKKIYEVFKTYRSKKFIMVKPGGNFGDELIYLGCDKLINKLEINNETVSYAEFMETEFADDCVVYIHGGGGVNPFCSGRAIELILKAINYHKGTVVVGPQTYFDDNDYIREVLLKKIRRSSNKVYLFARDMRSFSSLSSCFTGTSIIVDVDHDTALNLEAKDFSSAKFCNRLDRVFIRTDREATASSRKHNFFSIINDPVTFAKDFDAWLDLHSSAKTILTNRLHSAIAGMIFKKNVVLLPNVYHKNKSVWEYSLKDYDDIQWSEKLKEKLGVFEKLIERCALSKPFQKLLVSYSLGCLSVKKYRF